MQKKLWVGRGGPPAAGAPCHGTNDTMVNPALIMFTIVISKFLQ